MRFRVTVEPLTVDAVAAMGEDKVIEAEGFFMSFNQGDGYLMSAGGAVALGMVLKQLVEAAKRGG